MPRHLLLILLRAIVLACVAGTGSTQAKLTVMHGYADFTSVLLWILTDAPGPVAIAWRAEGDERERSTTLDATAANDHVVLARLTGLAPGKSAAYRIVGDGDRREGTLRAQPFWSKATDAQDIVVAIGSCFFLADASGLYGGTEYGGGYEIFDAIAAKSPDVMLWLGDNLYFQTPDFLDPSSMAARYKRQRTHSSLAKLLVATSHLAIWDDHDYGPNDADASYVMKGEALKLFQRWWANPSQGLPDTPGIFGTARRGDVEFFLLDDRYYRSANRAPEGPDKMLYGTKQLAWLKNALIHSRAPIKIIAGGGQFWNKANRFEGWNHFATEQAGFAAWLIDQKIEGVLFLSGDRHFGELLKIDRPGAYPLYEFTSSPLASRAWANPEAGEQMNPDVVPGTLIGKRQFGLIRVSGPGSDRRLALESYDTEGVRLWRHEVRARDLKFPRTGSE